MKCFDPDKSNIGYKFNLKETKDENLQYDIYYNWKNPYLVLI